jgi:hypothetical protein
MDFLDFGRFFQLVFSAFPPSIEIIFGAALS